MTPFPLTTGLLEELVEEGAMTRGAQVCVTQAGDVVLDTALGDAGAGLATTPETVFKVYCAIKPVTAVAVAGLVDAGLVDLDRPMAEVLPSVDALARGGVTARHVLTHTAGLHEPSGIHMELLPEDQRRAFVDRTRLPSGWRVGRDAGYSEVVGWHLLGRLVEAVTGEPLRDHLRTSVLDPLGMASTWVGMTEDEYAATYDRLGMNYDLRGWPARPVLLERAQRACCEVNCAYGGYTTARDLARFYTALLARLGGGDQTLAAFCAPARPLTYDVVLKRECEYGLGFMTALAGHHFGEVCSPASFGHSGWLGTSFAFADPASDLAVAVVLNGIIDSAPSFLRRPALTRAVYADLGLGS